MAKFISAQILSTLVEEQINKLTGNNEAVIALSKVRDCIKDLSYPNPFYQTVERALNMLSKHEGFKEAVMKIYPHSWQTDEVRIKNLVVFDTGGYDTFYEFCEIIYRIMNDAQLDESLFDSEEAIANEIYCWFCAEYSIEPDLGTNFDVYSM